MIHHTSDFRIACRLLCGVLLLGLLLPLLSACHDSFSSRDELQADQCKRTVRVVTRISNYGIPSDALTRATDTTPAGSGAFKPQEKEGIGAERTLYDLFLLVIDPKDRSKNVYLGYYYKQDGYLNSDTKTFIHGHVTNDKFQGREGVPAKPFKLAGDGMAEMELDLHPGTYEFYVIANSHAARNHFSTYGLITYRRLASLNNGGKIYKARPNDAADEKEFFAKDFPIVGRATINVPAVSTTKPLAPEIPLERVYARLDAQLITGYKDANGNHYFTTDADGKAYSPVDYAITGLELVLPTIRFKENKPPELFAIPAGGEYTGIENSPRRGASEINGSDRDYTLNVGKEKDPSEFWRGSKYFNSKLNAGGIYTLGLFPKDDTDPYKSGKNLIAIDTDNTPAGTATEDKAVTPAYLYIPSIYLGTQADATVSPERSVRLQLTFEEKLGLDAGKKFVYRIPLVNGTSSFNDYYSIRRNTIYHLALSFYGNYLITPGVSVLPWQVVDQTIEIDPNGDEDTEHDWVVPDPNNP